MTQDNHHESDHQNTNRPGIQPLSTNVSQGASANTAAPHQMPQPNSPQPYVQQPNAAQGNIQKPYIQQPNAAQPYIQQPNASGNIQQPYPQPTDEDKQHEPAIMSIKQLKILSRILAVIGGAIIFTKLRIIGYYDTEENIPFFVIGGLFMALGLFLHYNANQRINEELRKQEQERSQKRNAKFKDQ